MAESSGGPVAGAEQENAMTDSPYKLQVKIGPAEFSAEGPENTVKEAYEQFLKAVSGPTPLVSTISHAPVQNAVTGGPADITALDQEFIKDGDIVSLRHLPSTLTVAADAAIV